MSIGDTIKERRLAVGLSSQCLSEILGISNAYLNDIEQYNALEMFRNVDILVSIKLCDLLSITICELLELPPMQYATDLAGLQAGIMDIQHYLDIDSHELSEIIGWDINQFILNYQEAYTWSIDCLIAVCGYAGMSWVEVLKSMSVDNKTR